MWYCTWFLHRVTARILRVTVSASAASLEISSRLFKRRLQFRQAVPPTRFLQQVWHDLERWGPLLWSVNNYVAVFEFGSLPVHPDFRSLQITGVGCRFRSTNVSLCASVAAQKLHSPLLLSVFRSCWKKQVSKKLLLLRVFIRMLTLNEGLVHFPLHVLASEEAVGYFCFNLILGG